jgi:hypothetical protein
MKLGLFAAATAAVALSVAAPVSAAVLLGFAEGGASPAPGMTVFEDFEGLASSITSGSLYQIKTAPSDSNGAVIPTSTFPGTKYLSVLGGGNATITFAPNVRGFSFDWGSTDAFNTLRINYNSGLFVNVIPGTTFVNVANGNQVLPITNGRFTVHGNNNEVFNSIQLSSSAPSFEVDNIAAVVPEPATWAMMIIGFGAAGSIIRRRREVALTA